MSKIRIGITILIICLILATIPTALCAMVKEKSCKLITEEDNGKTIAVKKGDNIIIRFKENPSTGYSWSLTTPLGLKIINDAYEPYESSVTKKFGAPGHHYWIIRAIGTDYQQVWGEYKGRQNTSPIKTFEAYILIK